MKEKPMRRFKISYPSEKYNGAHVTKIVTEQEVLSEYYPFWSKQLEEKGLHAIAKDKERCIDDWIAVHWAVELPPGNTEERQASDE